MFQPDSPEYLDCPLEMTSRLREEKCCLVSPEPMTRFSVWARPTPSKAPTSLEAFFWEVTKPCSPVIVAVFLEAS